VTEGGSSTAFIITNGDAIVTRPLSQAILPGITRRAVMRLAQETGLSVEERPFSIEEACGSAEAFFTSASSFVMPVVQIDAHLIGDGHPGVRTRRLRDLYLAMARE
jgi:D-alanine transaminase